MLRTSLAATLLACACALGPAGGGSAAAQEGLPLHLEPFTGDFGEMLERRRVRVLVPSSLALYFVDGGTQRGLVYDFFREWEKEINRGRARPVEVVFVPVRRDELLTALLEGRGDVAGADLTETPARRDLVDFTVPFARGVHEVVVRGPSSPPLGRIEDLAGHEVFVRPSSSYWETLTALNERFAAEGRPAMVLRQAPEELLTADCLEMLNAGIVDLVVSDLWKARFWAQIFPNLEVREDLVLADAGDIAFAIRKDSPELRAALDPFVARHAVGTLFGNLELRKYLQTTRWVQAGVAGEHRERFLRLVHLFELYGARYGFDWMLLAAQGYQESRLDPSARSAAGAIGVMQLLPATGRQMAVGDIREVDANIHAGAKYLRQLLDVYFSDAHFEGANRSLFAFAAYNAGPGRIAQLRKQAAAEGLDPDVWFDNVEAVVARKVGRETVSYVANIYKYYLAYKLMAEREAERARARQAVGAPP